MLSRREIACAQGVYFTVTGIWPLVHMESFEAVTGPKVDKWLVRTVGVLVAAIGGVLASAAYRGRVTPEIAALGVASAGGLGAIDVIYAGKRRISPIYLADAALEAVLVGAWATGRDDSRSSRARA
jgi:hypothetical protein